MVFPVEGRASGGEAHRQRDETSHGRTGYAEVEELKVLPDNFDSFIQAKLLVERYNRNPLAQCLSHDLPVKGIVVKARELEHAERMIGAVRQDANSQVVHRVPQHYSRK